MRTALKVLLWMVAIAWHGVAFGNMQLSNVIFHFEPGETTRQDVEVYNAGDKPLYVEVTPTVVIAPGEANEDRRPIADPRADGLLVTPNKLIVPPGGTKAVRLVKMGNTPHERVYRVAFKPVVSGVQAEQSGLKIMIGYEVLAIVYPNNKKPELVFERTGQALTVRNVGNTNVLLREGMQCATEKMLPEECTSVTGRRMYPGNVWQVALPNPWPVTFYQSVGMRNFVETYP